jgi:hypothetical protein
MAGDHGGLLKKWVCVKETDGFKNDSRENPAATLEDEFKRETSHQGLCR